jgi:hypothetical protein
MGPRFFCTKSKASFRLFERTCFSVPSLRRVFGCFESHEIAASGDLMGEFVRRPLPKSPVRPTLIVFPAPSLYDPSGFGQARKPVGIQAFGSEGPVERLHKGIVHWFTRTRKGDSHSVLLGP